MENRIFVTPMNHWPGTGFYTSIAWQGRNTRMQENESGPWTWIAVFRDMESKKVRTGWWDTPISKEKSFKLPPRRGKRPVWGPPERSPPDGLFAKRRLPLTKKMFSKCPVTNYNQKLIRLSLAAVASTIILFYIYAPNSGDPLANSPPGNAVEAEASPPPIAAALDGPRVAICLVGGARRFELTGPSVLDRVVNVFPNSDVFLHAPLDEESYKFSILKESRRLAAVRIFKQRRMPESQKQKHLLTTVGSPNGMQGLLQYFKLVEGCKVMIDDYQTKKPIRYDWIVRTRVDSYWSAPITPDIFVPGTYVVPTGCEFLGLNDRFGAGDLNTSWIALSRFTMLDQLFASGYRHIGSERAFKEQLQLNKVRFRQVQVQFCIVSDRTFRYPPQSCDTPVAPLSSKGSLGGAYCRPCLPVCKGKCATKVLRILDPRFSWVYGDPELCDGRGAWGTDWERIFDNAARESYAATRKRIGSMDLDQCIRELDAMKNLTGIWDAPTPTEICKMGLLKNLNL